MANRLAMVLLAALASWLLQAGPMRAQEILVHDYYAYNEEFYPGQQGAHPDWSGWDSGSGVTTNLSSTGTFYSGSTSLQITPQTEDWSWNVRVLQTAGVHSADHTYFECYIRGSAQSLDLKLYFEGFDRAHGAPGWGPVGSIRFPLSSNTPSPYLEGGTISSRQWRRVRIPLSAIVSLDSGIALLSIYKVGLLHNGAYSTFYLDNIGFVRSTEQAYNIAVDDHSTPAVDETATLTTDFTDQALGSLAVDEIHSQTNGRALTFQSLLGSSFRIKLHRPGNISKIYLTQGSLSPAGYGWDLAKTIKITLGSGQTLLFSDTHNVGFYREEIIISPPVVSSYVDVKVLEVYDNTVSPGQDTMYGGFTEAEILAANTYADHMPPEIQNLTIDTMTYGGNFTTNEPAYFNVRYATTSLIGQETGWTSVLRTSHNFTLPSNVSGIVQVHVTDQYGNLVRVDDRTFSVLGDQDVALAIHHRDRLSDLRVDGWGVSLKMAASWRPDPFRSNIWTGPEVKLGYGNDIVSDPTRIRLYGAGGYFDQIEGLVRDADLRGYDTLLLVDYSSEHCVTSLSANALNAFKIPVSERGVPFYLGSEYCPAEEVTYDGWLTELYGASSGSPAYQALSAEAKSILEAQYHDRIPFSFADWLSHHYDLTPGQLAPGQLAQYQDWYDRTVSVLNMNEVERLYFYIGELARAIKQSGLGQRVYLVFDYEWNWASSSPYPIYQWDGWGHILADFPRMLEQGLEPELSGITWEKLGEESDDQWLDRVASEIASAPDKAEPLFVGTSEVTTGLGSLPHMNQLGPTAHKVFDTAAPKFDFLSVGTGRQDTWVQSSLDHKIFSERKQWLRYFNTTFFKPTAIHSSGIFDSRYVLTANPGVDIESDCVDRQRMTVRSHCPPYEPYAGQAVTLQPHGNEDLQNYDWYRLFTADELYFLRQYGVMFVSAQEFCDFEPEVGLADAGFFYYLSGQRKRKKSFYTLRDASDTVRLDGQVDGRDNRTIISGTVRVDGITAIPSNLHDPPSFSPVSTTLHSRATIIWQTMLPCRGQIWYGTEVLSGPAALNLMTADPDDTLPSVHTVRYDQQSDIYELSTAHSITLMGLAHSTTYHFRVKAIDAGGNVYVSDDYTFTTPSAWLPTDPPHADGYLIHKESEWRFRFQRLDSMGSWFVPDEYDDGEGGKAKTEDASNAWFRNWIGGVAPFGIRKEAEQATCIAPTGWLNKVCDWWPEVPPDDYYFRRHFYVSSAEWGELQTPGHKLILEIRYDNRFEAFINGAKVAENLDPRHLEAGYESFDVSAHMDVLRQGHNVLAIDVKPRGVGGTLTMLFDAALKSEAPLNRIPVVGAVIPASGSSSAGLTTTFTTTWSDPDGWQNLKQCYFHIGDSPDLANNVTLLYNAQKSRLWIRSDDGTQWLDGCVPGSSGNDIVQNSQAIVYCAETTVQGSEDTLMVRWAIAFKLPFAGAKKTGLKCRDVAGARGIAQWKGTWTISP